MAATISANSAGGGGLVTSGDASGVLALQTAGVTALSISAAQVVSFTNPVASLTLTSPVINGMGSSILTSGTAVASTSGTSIDFTGIPSWAKRITVMFNGVSTNGSSNYLVQIGSGTVEATGYLGAAGTNDGTGVGATNYTTGFGIRYAAATQLVSGHFVLTLLGSNLWVASGIFASSSNTNVCTSAGNKTTAGTLDRVRITTILGTDTFDAGSINIMYE